MHSVRSTILGVLTKTASGGIDMEVHKAMLIYYAVMSNVCLRHSCHVIFMSQTINLLLAGKLWQKSIFALKYSFFPNQTDVYKIKIIWGSVNRHCCLCDPFPAELAYLALQLNMFLSVVHKNLRAVYYNFPLEQFLSVLSTVVLLV